MRKLHIFIISLFITIPCNVEGRTIYVDHNAPGPIHDGASWANAYNYLQDAIAYANFNLDVNEIWVAKGIHTPDCDSANPGGTDDRTATFQLINGVALRGGYAGNGEPDPNARDVSAYKTILSGDLNSDDETVGNSENSYNVVTGSNTDTTAMLDGFIIRGGNANGASTPERCGGGMVNYPGSPAIINCAFRKNVARFHGGGIYAYNSSSTITNCRFIGNHANDDSGGMACYSSSVTLTNCIFNGNTAFDHGGGLLNYYSSCTLTNCLFNGNQSFGAAGIGNTQSNMVLTNCTFSRNQADHVGGGIYTSSGNIPVVTNCIFWSNSHWSGVINESSQISAGIVNYSCVQGWTGRLGGVGNIGYDPLFVDPNGADNIAGTEDDNLRLLSWSPCINAGDNNAVPGDILTDLDGNARIINRIVDMGSYENTSIGPVLRISPREFQFYALLDGANPEEQVMTITNMGIGTLDWEITYDCDWLQVTPGSGSLMAEESNEITLSVDINSLDWGSYNCELTTLDAFNYSQTVLVDLFIIGPEIELSALELEFEAIEGEANPAAQVISIRNSGGGTLNWEISCDCNWLNAEPNSGSSMGEANEVTLSVDISGLAPGSYNCELMIYDHDASNSPQIVRIHLGIYGPEIDLSAYQFNFVVYESDVNPDAQILTIRNSAEGTLNWSITSDCDWLQVEPITGRSIGEPNEVTLSVDTSGLAFGIYGCNITISDPNAGNSPQTVYVKLAYFQQDVLMDFGDCPDPYYPTLLLNDGALHVIDPNVFLGSGIDSEPDGQPTIWADGDDVNGIPDEDGVDFPSVLFTNCTRDVNVVASCEGMLDAWFDFNADGDWAEPSEQIFASEPLNPGSNILTFSIPYGAAVGDTYARFRFSTSGGLEPSGPAPNGEVEDYLVRIWCDCEPWCPDSCNWIWPPCPPMCEYEDWIQFNKPECWCYHRQCHGDADGTIHGTSIGGYYWVGIPDLNILVSAWKVKEPPKGPGIESVPNGICADFDHALHGTPIGGYFRVGISDLNILVASWMVKEPPKGPGVPPDCWCAPIW